MNLVLTRTAFKQLHRLPRRLNEQVLRKLRDLAANPKDPTLDVKPMTGKYKGYLRIRVGALRILFFIENEDIVISAIGFRGGIY